MTLFLDSRKATARINASLENSISGIRTTKAFTNSAAEEEKVRGEQQGVCFSKKQGVRRHGALFHRPNS